MGIDEFVVTQMNPFTRKEMTCLDPSKICPIAEWTPGPYVRLEAGPLVELADAGGCRVGGPALTTSNDRFIAQLDLAAVGRGTGTLALFDGETGPSLQFFDVAPPAGAPARGRRLVPHLVPIDPKAEDVFERESENADLAHRIGWAWSAQGIPWTATAIDLEVQRAGLGYDLDKLRAAERRGVDVVAVYRSAMKWRLLWQLATDDDLGIDWGDGGRLIVLIREEDLAAQRFDRVVFDVLPFS